MADPAGDGLGDERLLLLAQEHGEVPTISALMHAATVRTADIAWDRRGRRLVLLANRYRWEAGDQTRVRSALRFESVVKVQRKGWTDFDTHNPGITILELLAFVVEGDTITLQFAGGAALRVTVECADIVMEDLSGPWRASRKPVHP